MAEYKFWDMPIGSGLKAERIDTNQQVSYVYDFENNNLNAEDWNISSGNFVTTSEDKHSGNYSGKFTNGWYMYKQFFPNTRIMPGQLILNIWLKAISEDATINVTYNTGGVIYYLANSVSISSSSWTNVLSSHSFTDYSNGGIIKIERIDHSSNGFYIDDIDIKFLKIFSSLTTLCKRGSNDDEDKGNCCSNWFKCNLPDMTGLPEDVTFKSAHLSTCFSCLGNPSEIPHVMATSQDTSWTSSSSISTLKSLELDPEIEPKRALPIPDYDNVANIYRFIFDISAGVKRKYIENDWGPGEITLRWYRLDMDKDGDSYLFNKRPFLGRNGSIISTGYSINGPNDGSTMPIIRVLYDRNRFN